MMSILLAKLCLAFIGVQCVQANTRTIRSTENCHAKYRAFPGHTACLTTAKYAVVHELTNAEKQALVDQHNDLRSKVQPAPIDMLKMSWDDEVAMIAKKWTDSCLSYQNGKLEHDTNQHRLIPGRFTVGQNLAAGYQSFRHAIDAWYAEESDYPYGTKYQSITAMVGHYTQMVWSKSYKLGCAKAECKGGIMVYACNYSPMGNIVPFTMPYQTGSKPKCKNTDKGLCDCGNLECANGSPLDMTNCACTCTERYYLNETTCKFSCGYDDAIICVGYNIKECTVPGPYGTYVMRQCPTLCKVCPYAAPEYNKQKTDAASQTASQTVVSGMALSLVILQSFYQYANSVI